MSKKTKQVPTGHGFGTTPVFLAAISTILGAVLFLRFGYAVAHAGLFGALLIILLGHMVTIPTALAIAEIATNRRVEGGGEYFIISRSFGTTIGAAIGVAFYFSQAVSVAFYMIAFAESFRLFADWIQSQLGFAFDPRMVSLPGTILLAVLVLTRGASLGVSVLRVVATILGLSLVFFFLGPPIEGTEIGSLALHRPIPDHDPLILVFAIVFPAFTGITAGVGLSGDLANPRKSIPLGTLVAAITGLLVYVAVALKLALSAPPETLASDQLIMKEIALWGPIIPIGLAAACLSSAIGSILVAPRTLQALAGDGVIPHRRINDFLARGVGEANEPRNATLVTVALALATVAAGNIDSVARLISMFFMVTYGALCAISVLEHFAARPGYRPSFRSKWYLSLLGAVTCFMLMFQMDPLYALLAIVVMVLIYRGIRSMRGGADDLAAIFTGVMTQATRRFQVTLQQRTHAQQGAEDWRPAVIMINGRTFSRAAPLQFFSWLCHRYLFGTYLHYVRGHLDRDSAEQSQALLARLIEHIHARHSAVYVDTMISPSMRSALAQTLQLPGISGMENNTILFELSTHDDKEVLEELHDGCRMALAVRMNGLVLRHGDHFFGNRSQLHIWLGRQDYKNASLMLMLAYILLGHPDWEKAEIRIFAAFPKSQVDQQRSRLHAMITTGRLPMSRKNLEIIHTEGRVDFSKLVESRSVEADLVILGFTEKHLERSESIFLDFPQLRDVLFVSAQQRILIE
ncbi:MAG: amino acid permease [bacterium]|nr:amino acid permease [bacterium]